MRNKFASALPAKAWIQGFALSALLLLSACDRRDRLTAPTQVLRVSPPAAAVKLGATKVFNASVITPSGAVVDALPTWTISSSSPGTLTLSPQTGLQTTLNTAGSTLGAQALITVSYEGLTTQSQVTVVPETGDPTTAYGIFTESLANGMLFDTPNPFNPDGAKIGADGGQSQGGSGTMVLQAATAPGTYTEGSSGLRCTVTGSDGLSYAFVYFSLGFPDAAGVSNDKSSFSSGHLKFDLRVPAGRDVRVVMESLPVGSSGNWEVPLPGSYTTFDDIMRSVSIPVSVFTSNGVNLSQFEGITFVAPGIGSANFDFYVDNIRLEP
jgi:hypothetical protein